MTIETLAETYRLHITRDDCGDRIIAGSRGHLYVNNGIVCGMALDTPHKLESTWERLGGKLWVGDTSANAKGRKVEDVKIAGLTDVKLAIKLFRIHPKPEISEEERQRRAERAKSLWKRRNQSRESALKPFREGEEDRSYGNAKGTAPQGLEEVAR